MNTVLIRLFIKNGNRNICILRFPCKLPPGYRLITKYAFMRPPLYLVPLAFVLFCNRGIGQQQQYLISGKVMDSTNRGKALGNANVQLLVQGELVNSAVTKNNGTFSIPLSRPQSFQVKITRDNYHDYASRIEQFSRGNNSFDLGIIYLRQKTINVDTAIRTKMISAGYVPTRGAINLFYALNPDLKGKTVILANYTIKYPVLPKFKKFRKAFKRQYKKDKKHGPPYIYTFYNPGADDKGLTYVHSQNTWLSGQDIVQTQSNNNPPFNGQYYAQTKKFVFVFFKMDGSKVDYQLYKYRVVYYSEDEKNNPEEYSKSKDATYGYALLSAHIYDVEVYDQATNKPVHLSDDTIDPNEIIQHADLYKKWHQILIQVYD